MDCFLFPYLENIGGNRGHKKVLSMGIIPEILSPASAEGNNGNIEWNKQNKTTKKHKELSTEELDVPTLLWVKKIKKDLKNKQTYTKKMEKKKKKIVLSEDSSLWFHHRPGLLTTLFLQKCWFCTLRWVILINAHDGWNIQAVSTFSGQKVVCVS